MLKGYAWKMLQNSFYTAKKRYSVSQSQAHTMIFQRSQRPLNNILGALPGIFEGRKIQSIIVKCIL